MSTREGGERSGTPGYVALHRSGELRERARRLWSLLEPCVLCPLRCGARRLSGEEGRCGIGAVARVASACLHRGEEPPLSGGRGSGTIFFSGCNMRCVYCQNHQISLSPGDWAEMETEALADQMLSLQRQGAHNISLVTPSHVVPQAVAALERAAAAGLELPLVYNTSAYDRVRVLRELAGVVDIYLPDFKYGDERHAGLMSGVTDYVSTAQRALREMVRQVGELRTDEDGVARRGLILRHLVLPGDLSASERVLRFVAAELGPRTHVSLMAQYHPPAGRELPPPLHRPLRPAEYETPRQLLHLLGLHRGWVQDLISAEVYVPDFEVELHPFER